MRHKGAQHAATTGPRVGDNVKHAPTRAARSHRGRKIAAILTGGVMIGVGAVVTLASWNDSEYASGTFTAGKFDLEGSIDSTNFAEHASVGAPASVSFSSPYSNLTPTDVVYAPFAVRLAANTTTGATLAFGTPTATGTVTNLTYGVVKTSTFGCDASAFSGGTSVVADGTAMTAGTNANFATLLKGSPTTNAGAPVFLCFKVTAGSGLTQGQTGVVTWTITATSNGV